MTILIFGENGQVGRACQHEAKLRDIPINTINRREANFCRPDEPYSAIIKYQPNLVINAAAYTAVDNAETETEMARIINTESPAKIADACQLTGIPLIHLSTDYVFDGKGTRPYDEKDKTNPKNIYGQTKLQGEQSVLNRCEKALILRTSWIFGIHGGNFVKTMLRLGKERKQLSIIDDQIGCPTFANHIAESIFDLVTLQQTGKFFPYGIYHMADKEPTTWFNFALEIFAKGFSEGIVNQQPHLRPIKSSEYPTAATRPNFSVLNCHKLETLLKRPMKQWTTGLDQVIASIKNCA